MIRSLLLSVLTVLSCIQSNVDGFCNPRSAIKHSRVTTRTALFYFPDNYNRAVTCATHPVTCKLEELESLAEELDEYQHDEFKGGCFFDVDPTECEKDWDEMQQVKRILKVESKLHHMKDEYLERHQIEKLRNTFDMMQMLGYAGKP